MISFRSGAWAEDGSVLRPQTKVRTMHQADLFIQASDRSLAHASAQQVPRSFATFGSEFPFWPQKRHHSTPVSPVRDAVERLVIGSTPDVVPSPTSTADFSVSPCLCGDPITIVCDVLPLPGRSPRWHRPRRTLLHAAR